MGGSIALMGGKMVTKDIFNLLSDVAPSLVKKLISPVGSSISSLISLVLGVNMNNPDSVKNALLNPDNVKKLEQLDEHLDDLQNARAEAAKETGNVRYVRPFLVFLAMIAIFFDIILINYLTNETLIQLLTIFLVALVWDVRQAFKFYFGKGEDMPSFLTKFKIK